MADGIIKASVTFAMDDLIKKFQKTLKNSDEIIKQGLETAGAIIKRAIKARAPVRSGALKASYVYFVIHLTKQRMRLVVRPSARYRSTYKGKRVVPYKYAHLMEYGFKQRDGKRNPGRPHIRSGFASVEARATKVFTDFVTKGIEKELKK